MNINRILKEPLIHFFVLGALVFAGYAALNRHGEAVPGRITISRGQLASMMESFTRTRQRSPTREEWKGLIRDRVREEVYYREALALGLDKDDLIIRRRLRQKLDFVSEDIAAQTEPTDADLSAYLKASPESFRVEPRFTFSQVYLNPERHGDKLVVATADPSTFCCGSCPAEQAATSITAPARRLTDEHQRWMSKAMDREAMQATCE